MKSRGAATTTHFADLPEDVLTRILTEVPVTLLPRTLVALRLTCHQSDTNLSNCEGMWHALSRRVEEGDDSSSDASPAAAPLTPSPSRRSERLRVVSAELHFRRRWAFLISQLESLHHAIAFSGQDVQDLSVSRLRQHLARWGSRPAFVDRPSPVYNATLLMEVCRARGIRESTIVQLASHLIFHEGADPSARPADGADSDFTFTCTPLIIAASRGMPRLAAFLLGCGADPAPRGRGRFRLCGRAASLAGHHSALEWVERLLKAEEAAGVDVEHRRGLVVCARLLERMALLDERAASRAPRGARPSRLSEALAAARKRDLGMLTRAPLCDSGLEAARAYRVHCATGARMRGEGLAKKLCIWHRDGGEDFASVVERLPWYEEGMEESWVRQG